jgi:hypothetical protein
VITLLRTDLDSLYESGDPKLMAGFVSSLAIRMVLGAAVGLIGALIAWIAIRRSDSPPSWFLSASGLFGLAWVFFFPIGTVVAAYMLQWRLRVIRSDMAA